MQALSIRNLRKMYKNGFQALKGIDLDVAPGDFFALLGPNGAGKSTTIGILCSLVNKTSGKISVFGHDLDQDPHSVRRAIGLVPQEINFNQFETVINIVVNQAGYYGIGRRKALIRAEQVLTELGLWDRRNTISRQLSGGMKRRLMIARALVHEPRLLILDEPTAGVDIEIRRSMWDYLKEINRADMTIILTTHYLEEAENLCRHIAIIDQGQIVEHSAMPDLLARLHINQFILELKTPITQVPDIPGYGLELTDAVTLTARVPTELGIHRLFNALATHDIEVLSLRNAANRLEQIFVDLVDHNKTISA
ncbi:MAG: ABC transporter ATP-binding protein [Methylococcaceae bacterium]